MVGKQELSGFIHSTFRTVWSLELLLFLKAHRERAWSPEELVAALRGSDLLVARSLDALFAAGLVDAEEDGSVRYRVAAPELDERVAAVEAYYARSPDAVRRIVVSGAAGGGLAAFADAFKFRRD